MNGNGKKCQSRYSLLDVDMPIAMVLLVSLVLLTSHKFKFSVAA